MTQCCGTHQKLMSSKSIQPIQINQTRTCGTARLGKNNLGKPSKEAVQWLYYLT